MKKIYKFDFSKYSYVIDEENHEFKIFRFDEEDITNKAMNNPLLDLLLAYDNLKEEYDKLKEELDKLKYPTTTGHWIEKIVRGSLGLFCSECGCQNDTICPSSYCQNCGSLMTTEKLSEN